MNNILEIFQSELIKNYNNSIELKTQINSLHNLIMQYKHRSPAIFTAVYGFKLFSMLTKSTDVLIKQAVVPLFDKIEEVHLKFANLKWPRPFINKIHVPQYYGGILTNQNNCDLTKLKNMNFTKKMNFLEENFLSCFLPKNCILREDFNQKLKNVIESLESELINPVIVNTKVVDIRNINGSLDKKFVLKGDVQFESTFFTINSNKKQKRLANYKVEVVINLEENEVEDVNFTRM